MDVPGAHAPCIEGQRFFFNAGDIPLVFRNEFWLKLAFPVSWDINLEFPILALQCLGRVPIPLIGCLDFALLILFITESGIQLCFHEFLENVLETVPEQAVDISHTV